MTEQQMLTNWMAAQQALTNLGASIEAAISSQMSTIVDELRIAMNSGNAQNFRSSFQQLFNIGLRQARDVNFLRSLQPYLPHVLGIAGCTWMRIEVCSLALTGALASEIILGFLTAAAIILAAACAILILWFIIFKFLPALWNMFISVMTWVPGSGRPQGSMPAQWNTLSAALLSPTYGPAYAINNGVLPSGITLG